MPKRRGPVIESAVARDILHELEEYARIKQVILTQNGLYAVMTGDKGYKLSISAFNWWFSRLVEERFIEIDWRTRALRLGRLQIVEKENINIDF